MPNSSNDTPRSLAPSFARKQRTVAGPVRFHGRSLFHGYVVNATILPADSDTGIIFRRTDLVDVPDIPATTQYIAHVPRRTALAASKLATVETIEHLMAAMAGLHVDNCLIEIDAPEVPSYDGSCRDFCDGILEVGTTELDANARTVVIETTTTINSADGSQSLKLWPSSPDVGSVTYELSYGLDAPIADQEHTAILTPDHFYEHISNARTFVMESEISALQQMGYGKHLTAKDIVVVGESGIVDNELRYPDEAARHKVLDCIGDLALSGVHFAGHVKASRSGHHLNHELARVLSSLAAGNAEQQQEAA